MPRISKARQERRDRFVSVDQKEIGKWAEQLGSESTRTVWPRVLANFCLAVEKTPSELIHIGSEVNDEGVKAAIRDLLADYQKRLRTKGLKGSTVAFSIKVVKSWLAYNGIEFPHGFVRVRDADHVYREKALSKADLRRVLHMATRREKVAVALVGLSGLRPMVLGDYAGTDGLRVGDIVDLKIGDKTVSFSKVPARVVVRESLSKARHEYSTFLPSETCEYMAEYLAARLRPSREWRKGERITKDSPVIIPERDGRHFLTTTNIGDVIRNAVRRAGLGVRPYNLRTTFGTRLLSAESNGVVLHSVAQFWMGHSGDMTARYAQNRGDLPPEVVEEMRAAFRNCEPYVSSAETADLQSAIQKNVEARMRIDMLGLIGVTESEAAQLVQDPDFDIAEFAKKRLGGASAEIAPPRRPGEQRVIEADATDRYLEAGWTFRSPVNSTKAVVEWLGPMPEPSAS